MARFKRLTGYDVMFLTGTDEHGQRSSGLPKKTGLPQGVRRPIVAGIKELRKTLDISYDHFIRTTDPEHQEIVQKILKAL